VALRWLTAPILLIPMLGCEGRTTTDTLPWSCNEPSTQCPITPEPAGLAGFWRFDDASLGGEWVGGNKPEWSACDDQGSGEWATHQSVECGSERLGGFGASLRLVVSNNNDGEPVGGYVDAALPSGSADGPLTLAAWVSVYRSSTEPMSVVSVVRPSCQSAWLELHTHSSKRSLVLYVERPGPTSDACEVDASEVRLPSAYLDWGLGNWYHVAATVNGSERALFVDGSLKESTTSQETEPVSPAVDAAVHIGADPRGTAATLFSGMIDDVALFDRALSEDELKAFATESTSVLADSQPWTPWSADGSSATWHADCRNPDVERSDQGAAIVVQNGYWSAGGLFARTPTRHRISRLKKATLVADIPNANFDFVLGSRHNAERCTWHARGVGKNRYEFSLDDVKHCDCPKTCDCTFNVEEARVGSRWDENGTLGFSVCRVEFEWEPEEDSIVELGPGGMRGLNDWCWRPISYHQEATVDIDEAHTDEQQTVGWLQGGNSQTAYLAADFAEETPDEARQLCNLENAGTITLHADMPAGFNYQFRIADFNGVGREWSRQWSEGKSEQTFTICADDPVPTDADCGEDRDPIRHRQQAVDLKQIRYLGVQKAYEEASEGTISIDRVDFSGPVTGSCGESNSTGGAGPG